MPFASRTTEARGHTLSVRNTRSSDVEPTGTLRVEVERARRLIHSRRVAASRKCLGEQLQQNEERIRSRPIAGTTDCRTRLASPHVTVEVHSGAR